MRGILAGNMRSEMELMGACRGSMIKMVCWLHQEKHFIFYPGEIQQMNHPSYKRFAKG